MNSSLALRCRPHGRELRPTEGGRRVACSGGCEFPVDGGVIRCVTSQRYAGGFGLQWNTFRQTQLDSATGTTISRDRLARILGGSLDEVAGRRVLEVGCGAGRFTEVLLNAGARVVAVDLSSAVDANFANNGHNLNLAIWQTDVASLPFGPGQFDAVVAVGMVQHTPSPEQTMGELCAQLRSGGLLALDHYAPGGRQPWSRRALRQLLLRLPPRMSLAIVRGVVTACWPIHRALCSASGHMPEIGRLYHLLVRISPIVDYQRAYPELSPRLLRAWATLDTHDAVTDRYKHLRTAEQIHATLETCGMERIETAHAGNGVEARARRSAAGQVG